MCKYLIKGLRKYLVLYTIIGVLFFPICTMAAGTVVVTAETLPNNDIRTLIFTCTADAADGSFPDTTLTADQYAYVRGFHFYQALTDPGSTAPTANYDIVVNDAYGGDISGGELSDRSSTATERIAPKVGNAYGGATVNSNLTVQISNNSVNSATVVIILMFSR